MNSKFRLILAFGSNLGDLRQNFLTALDFFHHSGSGFSICKQSAWHRTSPFQSSSYQVKNHNDYLNFVCDVVVHENPIDFYRNFIVPIEDQIGHSREQKWMPRSLDVDILLSAYHVHSRFDQCTPLIVQTPDFCVPHREILHAERVVIKNMLLNELNLDDECIKCHVNLAAQQEKK